MRFSVFITLLVLSLAVVSPAAAQELPSASSTPTATETDADQQGVWIDSNTRIVSSEYLPSEGVARLTIHSEIRQSITLTDAGAFNTGGQVSQRTAQFYPGDTITMEITVTEVQGTVGVGVETSQVLWAELVQRGGDGSLDILSALGSIQAWVAGISIAFIWMAIAGWSVMRNEDGAPEVA